MQVPDERTLTRWLIAALLATTLSNAWGQGTGKASTAAAQPAKPASETPRPDQLEPGVNTSATPTPATSTSSDLIPAPAPLLAPTQTALEQAPGSGSTAGSASAPGTPGKPSSTARARKGESPPKAGAAPGKAQDRLELDATQITGNRELPKVLYIVPWKRSDLGDLVGRPVNSLLDEVLAPVDRDVFKRQNRYYDVLKPDEAKEGAGATAGSVEKH